MCLPRGAYLFIPLWRSVSTIASNANAENERAKLLYIKKTANANIENNELFEQGTLVLRKIYIVLFCSVAQLVLQQMPVPLGDLFICTALFMFLSFI